MKYFSFALIFFVFLLTSCQQANIEKEPIQEKQRALTTEDTIKIIPSIKIPFDEFMQRWNAISDEYTYENYIESYKVEKNENEQYALATIDHEATINVKARKDYIDIIQITTPKYTTEEKKYSMLSSWMQVVMLTNPQIEMSEIDRLFSELKIGPNATIETDHSKSITYGQVEYRLKISQENYQFTATLASEE